MIVGKSTKFDKVEFPELEKWINKLIIANFMTLLNLVTYLVTWNLITLELHYLSRVVEIAHSSAVSPGQFFVTSCELCHLRDFGFFRVFSRLRTVVLVIDNYNSPNEKTSVFNGIRKLPILILS